MAAVCSILAILEIANKTPDLREEALKRSRRQRHRGPDWSGVYEADRAILVHERLAIVDVEHGAQPLLNPERTHALAVNGEIYNHKDLERRLSRPFQFQTASDCEVILALYAEKGAGFLNDLSGIFAFVLWDEEKGRYLIARDPIGVMPLYMGRDAEGRLWVASELKAIVDRVVTLEDFPPGSYLDSEVGEIRKYYQPAWRDYEAVEGVPYDPYRLRGALEDAVRRQLMCDVPYGVLLSGGLDSSLLARIAHNFKSRRIEDGGATEAWWPQLHSFAIGLTGSPDLAAARIAAQAIGTVHHELHYTVQEGIDALRDVIYHLETFDVTTVRASTPMYLMARRIKAMGIKMVMTGEGSDEVFAGYLYFHKAPSPEELHAETVRKLDMLYKYDCLRANKSMAAWGIEARVPFLDRELLDVSMAFDPAQKMVREGRMEKWALRNAFTGMLPDAILWRQKEQFSDGVGYGWIDSLKALAEQKVSEADMVGAKERFPINTPVTKEAYFYRGLFDEHFPGELAARCVPEGPSVACSTPTAIRWDASFAANADPSGRAVRGVHKQSY